MTNHWNLTWYVLNFIGQWPNFPNFQKKCPVVKILTFFAYDRFSWIFDVILHKILMLMITNMLLLQFVLGCPIFQGFPTGL